MTMANGNSPLNRRTGSRNQRNQPAATNQFNRNRNVLKTHESVVADILDTADGDFENYPDVQSISRGRWQYTPFPEVTWESANELRSEIAELREQRRIDAENARAERIANAVGSAVVVIPTTTRAFGIMIVVAIGLGTLLFSRKPWTNSGLLNAVVDTALYGGAFLLSCYIMVKMSNAKSKAEGGVKREGLVPPTIIPGIIAP
ncbi:MAG: hypothetical protein ACTSPB_16805 [Candidatus Thorarchaeota archaeon]